MGAIMSESIRIVIADDHVLVLDGMKQALDSLPDISVIGIATNGRDLVQVLEQVTPDVLVVDIEMPHGTGITVLRSLRVPPPTLVVTMHADDEHRASAHAAGALGFLSKASPLSDLASAIRAINDRVDLIVEPDLSVALEPYREARLSPGADSLTPREREVLRLLAGGLSRTEDLADELYISQKTVKNHLASIYAKLHVSDRAQAAVEAIRLGLGNR